MRSGGSKLKSQENGAGVRTEVEGLSQRTRKASEEDTGGESIGDMTKSWMSAPGGILVTVEVTSFTKTLTIVELRSRQNRPVPLLSKIDFLIALAATCLDTTSSLASLRGPV